MFGLALFALTSLLCGLSTSSGMLIAARALQGLAGAALSPSVFSIVSVTFEEGSERNKALGILGAIAGSGAAIGVLLGGVLTQYVGWEWIFFVNVPIGLLTMLLRPSVRPREPRGRHGTELRLARSRDRDREPDAARLRAHAGRQRRLGLGADDLPRSSARRF